MVVTGSCNGEEIHEFFVFFGARGIVKPETVLSHGIRQIARRWKEERKLFPTEQSMHSDWCLLGKKKQAKLWIRVLKLARFFVHITCFQIVHLVYPYSSYSQYCRSPRQTNAIISLMVM